jgi:hypothetical protein
VKWVSSQQRGGSTIFSHWSHIFLNETYVSGAVVSDGGSENMWIIMLCLKLVSDDEVI